MKPITGSVVSSKPVSLSKAASILSRFVASETGAHKDVSAFLRRTAEAFDELAKFHEDLGTEREVDVSSFKSGDEGESRRRKKKKRDEAVLEAAQVHIVAEDNPGPSAGLFQHGGNVGFLDLKEMKSGGGEEKEKKKKKKKVVVDNEIDGRMSNVIEIRTEKREGGLDKRKEIDDVEEGRQMGGNVENHSERGRKGKRKKGKDVEGSGDGVDNHVERHHKKKRKLREESSVMD